MGRAKNLGKRLAGTGADDLVLSGDNNCNAQEWMVAWAPMQPSSRLILLIAPALVWPLLARAAESASLSIVECGAVGDGQTLNTKAIQATIDRVADEGGGMVTIPKGVFLSGAVFLKPLVNLHLDEGAVLKGSTKIEDYPKTRTRIEGHFEEWIPALVNAKECDHLRIDGAGTLDGSGQPFWELFWARRRADTSTKNLDVPRPRLCVIQNSKDVKVSGVHFRDSGFWNLHLYRCSDAVVENVRFEVPLGKRCPSTDGTDVDSCQNITIRGCFYSVDDDCVAIKGSKGPFALEDKDSPPVEHIHVVDCTFERGQGLVTLGSEATVVRDVIVERCKVTGPNIVARLKLRPDTPQDYEDIHYRDITLDSATGTIIQINPWRQYFDLQGQPPPKSVVRNITISNLKGNYGSFGSIQGNPGTDISGITIEDVDVTLKDGKLKTSNEVTMKNVVVNGEQIATSK
jgi:polygalacturonase